MRFILWGLIVLPISGWTFESCQSYFQKTKIQAVSSKPQKLRTQENKTKKDKLRSNKSELVSTTNIINGRNVPLSKIMQKLQEDSWHITNFIRKAKRGKIAKEERQVAFDAADSFMRLAEMMYQKYNTTLAPGRSKILIKSDKQKFFKMYEKYTHKFYRLSADLYEAMLSERWGFAEETLMEIEMLTVEAHQKIEAPISQMDD